MPQICFHKYSSHLYSLHKSTNNKSSKFIQNNSFIKKESIKETDISSKVLNNSICSETVTPLQSNCKGKLIVIEGADCVGKQTQSELLYNYYTRCEYPCHLVSFPDYSTSTGKKIKDILNKIDIPNLVSFPKLKEINNLYMQNRLEVWNDKLFSLYNQGYIIIADRYIPSNLIYPYITLNKIGIDKSVQEEYLASLLYNEHIINKLPIEDAIIILNMDDINANKLLANKRGKDKNETNDDYQYKVRQAYRLFTKKYNWHMIDCFNSNGSILNEMSIHLNILTYLANKHLT